jgi:hypothetical protein
MSRRSISLKSRVRYEGRVRTFDRRATQGADLEKLPNPLWHTVGQVLRKFRKVATPKRSSKAVPPWKVGPTSAPGPGK